MRVVLHHEYSDDTSTCKTCIIWTGYSFQPSILSALVILFALCLKYFLHILKFKWLIDKIKHNKNFPNPTFQWKSDFHVKATHVQSWF